ncbi:hypothetical protein Cfor_12842 [Coptotermes formosanus]|jgi:hypothetical protein|uniref:Reverse transcriptase domain-containing protein n=1 Tax=Coptotermes formosanus TaxID=36987 RepID=A0A6L2PFY5_COPFO|nr:hypothetical protein Cfor_12842 [Coptotermes formosanus]
MKKLYYNKQVELSSNRLKTTWKIIKETTGKTQSPDNNFEINSDTSMLTNINEISNAFNSYFVNIAENLNNKLIDVDKALQSLKKSYPENISEMKVIPVTEIEVIEIIKSFKNKNSSGYDRISINILKHCVNEVSKPLTFICNLSLATGAYPDRFKFAIVRPIHKNGDKSKITDYRPISLLSCSKLLETIMFNRLYQYAQTNMIY